MSPNLLASISPTKKLMPVALPLGRARLATMPNATGSSLTPKTIGIVAVADLAAIEAGVLPGVAITATRRRIRSASTAGKCSKWPSSQWYSITTFWPSTYPASLNPTRNAAIRPGKHGLPHREQIRSLASWLLRARSERPRDRRTAE